MGHIKRLRAEDLTIEPREEALERLLLLACEELIPQDLEDLADPEKIRLAEALTQEAVFWLDFVPRGVQPMPTAHADRLGAVRVRERRSAVADKPLRLKTRKPGGS